MANAETPTPVTHQALAQLSEKGQKNKVWLNVSRPLTAQDFSGRIVLIDFWTFCCINCMHVIPDLKKLEADFGHELTVIGVHSAKFENEKDTQSIRDAVLRYGIEHPVVNDSEFRIWRSFNVQAWPTLILLAPDGKIEAAYSGEGHYEELKKNIQSLKQRFKGKIAGLDKASELPIALEKNSIAPQVFTSAFRFPGKLLRVQTGSRAGHVFVSDSGNHRVVELSADAEILNEWGGFDSPQGLLAYSNPGNAGSLDLYVADTQNHVIKKIAVGPDAKAHVSVVAGTGKQGFERAAKNQPALKTPLASPWDLVWIKEGEEMAIAMAGTHQLWSLNLKTEKVSVLAGNGRESIDDGVYPANSLSQPSGLTRLGNTIYFVDSETSSLRSYDIGTRAIRTLVGTGLFDFGFEDGKGKSALMQHPLGIGNDGALVYIADSYNHAIRSYDPRTQVLTTLLSKRFSEPGGVFVSDGELWIADTNNHQIQRLNLKTKALSLFEKKKKRVRPNLMEKAAIQTSGKLVVLVKLQPGWKLNALAPSDVVLFSKADPSHLLAKFSREQIEKGSVEVDLGKQKAGPFRVEATLYFCESKEGSACMIRSVGADVELEPKAKASVSFDIELGTHQ